MVAVSWRGDDGVAVVVVNGLGWTLTKPRDGTLGDSRQVLPGHLDFVTSQVIAGYCVKLLCK